MVKQELKRVCELWTSRERRRSSSDVAFGRLRKAAPGQVLPQAPMWSRARQDTLRASPDPRFQSLQIRPFWDICHVRLAYLRQSLVRRARLRLAFKIQQRFARTTSDRLPDRFPVSTSRKNDNSRTRRPRQASPRVSWTCYHRRAQDWPALPRQTCRRCVSS